MRFLDNAENLLGKLPADVRSRISSYLLTPSPAAWDDIKSIVVASSVRRGTVWQAVRRLDPTFPNEKPDEGWVSVPDAITVARAIAGANT